jgi:hypothetical protein
MEFYCPVLDKPGLKYVLGNKLASFVAGCRELNMTNRGDKVVRNWRYPDRAL